MKCHFVSQILSTEAPDGQWNIERRAGNWCTCLVNSGNKISIINWIDSFLCQHENIWYSMNSNSTNSNKLFAHIEHHMGVVVLEVWVH